MLRLQIISIGKLSDILFWFRKVNIQMQKISGNSIIEIWGGNYINDISCRDEDDKNVEILQIERGSMKDDYIVEFIRKD